MRHEFVESLPDLIEATEYEDYPTGDLVRLRVTVSDDGVEVLGDGLRPELIEAVLAAIGAGAGKQSMEQMLCG